eukprot:g33878.t1
MALAGGASGDSCPSPPELIFFPTDFVFVFSRSLRPGHPSSGLIHSYLPIGAGNKQGKPKKAAPPPPPEEFEESTSEEESEEEELPAPPPIKKVAKTPQSSNKKNGKAVKKESSEEEEVEEEDNDEEEDDDSATGQSCGCVYPRDTNYVYFFVGYMGHYLFW